MKRNQSGGIKGYLNYKNLATQIKAMVGRFPFHHHIESEVNWGRYTFRKYLWIMMVGISPPQKKQMHIAYLQILWILLFCLGLDTYLVIEIRGPSKSSILHKSIFLLHLQSSWNIHVAGYLHTHTKTTIPRFEKK